MVKDELSINRNKFQNFIDNNCFSFHETYYKGRLEHAPGKWVGTLYLSEAESLNNEEFTSILGDKIYWDKNNYCWVINNKIFKI